MSKMAQGSKYDRLKQYLVCSGKSSLYLSFSEIEGIVGFELPKSAYKHPACWANQKSNPSPFVQSWMDAGYCTERLNMKAQTVTFKKIETKQVRTISYGPHQNIPTMTAEAAICLIQEYLSKIDEDSHARYMSWRHCYTVFSENRGMTDEQTVDYLSLHLAFYLASWGMYRGSSFLLQKDYKVHIPVVKIIQERKYNLLHGISAEELRKEHSIDLLNDIVRKIRECYAKESPALKGINNATDTLVTKILLGTLGCVPAFDRYFKRAIKKHHISKGTFNGDAIRSIAKFYYDNAEVFDKFRREISKCGIEYPPMKLMDMCFWQDAYIDEEIEKKRKKTSAKKAENRH